MQLVVQVAVTVLTVVYLRMGIIGVLIGNLVAALSIWTVLITSSMRICGFHMHRPTLTAIAKYGAPLMLSGLVVAGFQSIDRWALNSYATLEVLGIYALSLKIVNIIPMLVVTPFTNSYGPYRFAVMKQENAHEVYAQILTGYVFVSTCVVIALGSVSREVLHILAAPEYWPAARVVPILLIPAALSGVDYCFQTGIYIQKKTHYMLFGPRDRHGDGALILCSCRGSARSAPRWRESARRCTESPRPVCSRGTSCRSAGSSRGFSGSSRPAPLSRSARSKSSSRIHGRRSR